MGEGLELMMTGTSASMRFSTPMLALKYVLGPFSSATATLPGLHNVAQASTTYPIL